MAAIKDKVRATSTIDTRSAVLTRGSVVSLLKRFTSIRHPRLVVPQYGGATLSRRKIGNNRLPRGRKAASHTSHNIGVKVGSGSFFRQFQIAQFDCSVCTSEEADEAGTYRKCDRLGGQTSKI